MRFSLSRRQFLVKAGTVLGTLAASSQMLRHTLFPDIASTAELEGYEGFVFLGEDEMTPESVRFTGKYPNLERADSVIFEPFSSPKEMARSLQFPIYELGVLPDWLSVGPICVIRNRAGQVATAAIGYTSDYEGIPFTIVEVSAREVFQTPFPVRQTRLSTGPAPVERIRVDSNPAVHVRTEEGSVFFWMREGVLHTLRAEFPGSAREASSLLDKLAYV